MTIADFVFLAIILSSALVALLRGFFREFVSLASWAVAGVLSYGAFMMAKPYLAQFLGTGWFVKAVFLIGSFAGLAYAFSFTNRRLVERIRGEGSHAWDQVAGFFFGAARGLILVAVLVNTYVLIFTPAQIPAWLYSAKLYPLVTSASNSLKNAAARTITVPGDSTSQELVPIPVLKGTSRAGRRSVTTIITRRTASNRRAEDAQGYSKDERGAIDQLLQNTLDPP